MFLGSVQIISRLDRQSKLHVSIIYWPPYCRTKEVLRHGGSILWSISILDNAIHSIVISNNLGQINYYPVDSVVRFVNTYSLYIDLSNGYIALSSLPTTRVKMFLFSGDGKWIFVFSYI